MTSLADLLDPETIAAMKETVHAQTPEGPAAAGPAEGPSVVLEAPTPVPGRVGPSDLVTSTTSAKKAEITHNPGGTRMPFDYDSMTDAELGALTRQRLKILAARQIKAATPAVMAERAKHEAEEAAQIADRQEERKAQILPGFMVGSHLVPDLDLTGVTDLHEVVSAKQRSIYNKALHRVGMSLLDPETTTYATLLDKHETLRVVGAEVRVEGKKAKKKAKKAKQLTAVVATTEVDKAAALAEILGISKKKARELVNA